jgi:hypothetical protein
MSERPRYRDERFGLVARIESLEAELAERPTVARRRELEREVERLRTLLAKARPEPVARSGQPQPVRASAGPYDGVVALLVFAVVSTMIAPFIIIVGMNKERMTRQETGSRQEPHLVEKCPPGSTRIECMPSYRGLVPPPTYAP